MPPHPPNLAAVIPSPLARPLSIQSTPYHSPSTSEITIRNHALAFNPVDVGIQDLGPDLFPQLTYPFIGGNDVAGQVVEVGPDVTDFAVGDRVLGHALALSMPGRGGTWQLYTVLRGNMASKIPDGMTSEEAAVLPLGVSTAACGLYQKDCLALNYPSLTPNPTGKTLLIWGGSTSVGSNAIQLAVASGYDVLSTASPRNFEYVRGLGARRVWDYSSESAKEEILEELKGKDFAGAVAIGSVQAGDNGIMAGEACLDIVSRLDSPGAKKFVAMAMPFKEEIVPEGVSAKFIFGSDLKGNEVSRVIYGGGGGFLQAALREGRYRAVPEGLVVGERGLESVQVGLDRLREGVSARKVVVRL